MDQIVGKDRFGDPWVLSWLTSCFLLFSPAAVFGQTFHLSSANASPGEQVTIELSFKSPPGQEQPSALQWETTIPSDQLDLAGKDVSPGPTAVAAGKFINCDAKTKAGEPRTLMCILYGGQESIHDGVVAMLRLHISTKAKPGTARIRVDQGLAVSKDLKKALLDPIETVVKIRAK